MKDYYKILEVNPAATPNDIKKSFRKLALKYHPDRTNNNRLAEAKFKEIQEAYRTLSNPERKSHYDQKARDARYSSREQQAQVITPQSILHSLKKLSSKLRAYDEGRIDQKSLYSILRSHLSAYNLVILREHDDLRTNRMISDEALRLSRHFRFEHAEKVAALLKTIAAGDSETLHRIHLFLQRRKHYGLWEKYRILLVVVIAIILCFIIYKAAE